MFPSPEVREGAALEPAEPFPHREQVGERLARVLEVREGVDHRHVGGAGEHLEPLLLEGPQHDRVDVARQHPAGVLDRLAAAELQLARRQHDRMGAELRDADLERDPGAGATASRRPGRSSARRAAPAYASGRAFTSAARSRSSLELLRAQVVDGEVVVLHGAESIGIGRAARDGRSAAATGGARGQPARSSAPNDARSRSTIAATTGSLLLARERAVGRSQVDREGEALRARSAAARPGTRRTARTAPAAPPPPPRSPPARRRPPPPRGRRTPGRGGRAGTAARRDHHRVRRRAARRRVEHQLTRGHTTLDLERRGRPAGAPRRPRRPATRRRVHRRGTARVERRGRAVARAATHAPRARSSGRADHARRVERVVGPGRRVPSSSRRSGERERHVLTLGHASSSRRKTVPASNIGDIGARPTPDCGPRRGGARGAAACAGTPRRPAAGSRPARRRRRRSSRGPPPTRTASGAPRGARRGRDASRARDRNAYAAGTPPACAVAGTVEPIRSYPSTRATSSIRSTSRSMSTRKPGTSTSRASRAVRACEAMRSRSNEASRHRRLTS